MKNVVFSAYSKTKAQISCAVMTSAFVFAVNIKQFLRCLNPQFQASSHLLRRFTLTLHFEGSPSLLLVHICLSQYRIPID